MIRSLWCLAAISSNATLATSMGFLALFVVLARSLAGEVGTLRQLSPEELGPAERRQMRKAGTGLVFSLAGIAVCLGGLVWPNSAVIYLAALLFVLALGGAIAVLLDVDPESWFGYVISSFRKRHRIWKALEWSVLAVICVAAAVFLVRWIGDSSAPAAGIEEGPYEVSGTTCGNGSCTLNECEEAAACGVHSIGRLQAEQRIAIECQVRGGKVETPDGHHFSYIWDRLKPKVFVSDLFVEGTEYNRFAPSLPRCRGEALVE